MASSDYYLCDVCNSKTFYDAEVHYDAMNSHPVTHALLPDNVGDMAVICERCAQTFKVAVVAK